MLVVDANILVAELLRARGRRLVEDRRLRLRVSAKAWEEARHELSERAEKIIARGRLAREEANALLADGLQIGEARAVEIPPEAFVAFEEEAAYRIPRDPTDVPTVALALALDGAEGRCGVWTNDGDFLGCGIPTWTTETLLVHLAHTWQGRWRAQTRRPRKAVQVARQTTVDRRHQAAPRNADRITKPRRSRPAGGPAVRVCLGRYALVDSCHARYERGTRNGAHARGLADGLP